MPPRAAVPRPLLVAPDSFKGTLSAPQVAQAIERGARRAGLKQTDLCPVADGGEGTVEILRAQRGGQLVPAPATDPLGRPVSAGYALVDFPLFYFLATLGRTSSRDRAITATFVIFLGWLVALFTLRLDFALA